MANERDTENSDCHGRCAHCAAVEKTTQDDAPGNLAGWRLVFSAVVVFLLPLALAIIGGVVFRASRGAQTLGVFSGLVLGLLVAVVFRGMTSDE